MTTILALWILPVLGAASVRGPVSEDSFEGTEALALFDFTDEEGLDNDYLDQVSFTLVTQSPGRPVYSWFGHTGLVVDTPYGSTMYDWGVFSFSPSFYIDFVFGRLYYSLLPSRPSARIASATQEGRHVDAVPLPMDNAAKRATIQFLNLNNQPENRTYLYDYYFDNCATRVRDIINAASGGAFKTWAEGISTGHSLRELSTQCMSRSTLVSFTLNFLQASSIDHEATLWEACFLPSVLDKAVQEWTGQEAIVLNEGDGDEAGQSYLFITSLCAGVLLAALYGALLATGHRRAYGISSVLLWLYLFLLGTVLLFVMCFTDHAVTYGNENIAFVNPLLVIPFVQSLSCIIRGRKAKFGASRSTFRLLLALEIISLVLKGLFMDTFIQDNLAVHALVLPLYLVMAFKRRKDA